MARQQQMHQMPQQPQRPQPPQQPQGRQQAPTSSGASYYPTPAFQNHIEQLEQEYDAQADMVEDTELDAPSGPGPYPAPFTNDGGQMLSPTSNGPGHMPQHDPQTTGQPYPSMTSLLDHQNIDWDPFGLSASMAFPSQPYQLDQTNMR